jgi:hypothetical protein
MNEKVDLELFLSKLTVLCREHNITFFVAESAYGPESIPGLRPMTTAEKTWIYIASGTPFTPKDEWDTLELVSQKTLAEKRANSSDDEICIADERHIKLIEAGLD